MHAEYDLFPYIPEDFPLLQLSQEALDRLWTQVAGCARRLPEASSALVEDLYPLAGLQAGLLFHSQAALESGLYTEQVSFQVEGAFHLAAFVGSWRQLLRTHPILRTSFVGEDVLVQAVWQRVPLPLRVIDATRLSPQEQAELVQVYEQADRQCGFVIEQAPLLRLTVLRLGTQQHQVLWSFHHAILDGWSVSLLLQEFFACYQALSQGRQPHLPASRPYRDYIAWLQQQDQSAAQAFWRQQLADLTAPTPLPLKASQPLTPDVEPSYGQEKLLLSHEVSQNLQRVARDLHITVNTLLQASWAYVLSRYSGQAEVLFGMVVAGREAELVGVESLVGPCINTVPVRLCIPREGRVGVWLRQVHEQLAMLQRYSYYPLRQIQRLSELGSGQSLFQSILVFENYPIEHTLEQLQHSGLQLHFMETQQRTNYALSALVLPGEQVELRLSYQEQALEAELVSRMLELWQQVLEALVQQPDQPVAALPLLREPEQDALLREWNATERAYPQDACVQELFEQQAANHPDAIALLQGEVHLTYGELDRRANQLAHCLRQLGVGPEVLVGLCLERSLEMVVGLLAILKAGGAYVPLDPAYPPARLAFMVQDAQVAVLLTQAQYVQGLSAHHLPLLALDRDWQTISQLPTDRLDTSTSAENLAYVMYTSGSTGQPKGVEIRHRSITRLLFGVEYARLDGSRTLLHMAPISFDAATFEVWGALLHGARCILLPERIPTPSSIGALIEHQQVTTLWLTASLFNAIIDEAPERLRGLEQLLTGGEALSVGHIGRALQQLAGTQLINGYGPTESTTFTCCHPIAPELSPSTRSIPIGRPISNTQVYLLDAYLQPVPLGVVGELYIGGAGLARGYRNRPQLTAERFVPHPFSDQPGARLYRSGDLARYLADGTIEFVGRADLQVKIRGYRIELGEIEQVLLQSPAVREAVVLARHSHAGSKQLVAYVVLAGQVDERGDWRAGLRGFLGERLPEYMVPSHFVLLDALPLSANGKLDRHALPPPLVALEQAHQQGLLHPQGPIEELLAGIWQEILHVPAVTSHDNFFALGGHSLLAMQVVARIRQQLGLELPLRTFFEAPTLAAVSQWVQQQLRAEPGSLRPPLQPYPRSTPAPLSFAQERLWFLEQLEPGRPTYHVPLILRLRGPLNPAALQASLRLVEARHEVLRLRIEDHEGQAVQGMLPGGSSPLLHVDLSGLDPQDREVELRRLARHEVHRPFDLVRGPLWRTRLLRLDVHDWVLLLTMHHIITDGWSMQLLLQELTQAYLAHQQGCALPLAALPIQYADYALWQRQWLQGERLEAELAYWREQLADLEPVQLPTDHPRPSIQSSHGAREFLHLSAPLRQQLQALSRQEKVTLFMTLLAGWLLVLQRYSGQSDLAIGTPIAGRTQAELEGLIGFFVNTLVLRCRVEGQASVRELLAHVRKVTLGAYSHQEVPFERVVEALQPQRELSRSPLFQIMFAGQQEVVPQQSWEGITLQAEEPELDVAKFDLTLEVAESEQGIEAVLEYNTDLFEPGTVKRMLVHWQQALEALVQQSDQSVADVSLLREAERTLLLDSWNATERAYPQDACVQELFEQQAACQPDAIALVQGEAHLTYGELNRRANQLAHYLQRQGVGPEVRVGLCLERSPELIVAMIAVLKAGGAYMPLDVSLPQERLRYQLHDAQVLIALTQGHLLEKLTDSQVLVLCLDRDWQWVAREACGQLQCSVQPENLAYVIYTSGSTGRPKGTMISHKSLCNLLYWHCQSFGLHAMDRTTHLAGLGFDASVWELWPSLAAGASITLLDDLSSLAPEVLGHWLTKHGITISFVPTPVAERLVEQSWPSSCALRILLTGGDRLHRVPKHALPFQLINNYGPTEATVVATSGVVERATAEAAASSHGPDIGRAIANTQLYVLDEQMRPVPLGVEGELYLGGVQLARGYLDRPELTAERFVPDPFSSQPGAQLYRTGDVVRYLSDGRVQFVGRRDFQVKLRGYRIELGEVEQVLLQHPAVREAVVVARHSHGGSKQLVAFVVLAQPQQAGEGQATLRRFLGERLPDYMVPSHFIMLDALPLTATGKVDRQALLAHGPGEGEQQLQGREQPRDRIELQLLRIWERVLERGPISLTDNFFHLGGHSLAALRLQAQIQNEFHRQLPVGLLFQYPTIRELAQILRQEIGYVRGSALVPLQPHGSRAPFFCVHPAGGSVFCYLDLVRHMGMGYPVYGLQFPEVEEGQAIPSVEQLAAHYIAALQTLQPEGPYLLGGWSGGGIIAYEMACQLRSQGHEVALLCLFDSFRLPSGQPTQEHKQGSTLRESLVALNADEQEISCLTEEELLRVGYDALKRNLILPDGLDLTYVQRFIHIQAAISKAMLAYEPPHSDQRITLIRVEQERECVAEAVKDGREPARDSTYGWSAVTTAGVDVHTVPGTHNEMFREPYVQTVASTLRACLDERGKYQESTK